MSPSAYKALELGPNFEKKDVEPLQNTKDKAIAGDLAQRTQDGDRAPHSGKCRRAGEDLTVFLCMKARQQLALIDRA